VTAVSAASLFAGFFLFVLVRFGMLASTALLATVFSLQRTPLTLDVSAWYAPRAFVVLFLFTALLVVSFYRSLGGKPLFGRALLED
jgi:hypothetical protein